MVIDGPSFRAESTPKRTVIVMAAYNGSRFIDEQIESIRAQSYPDWMLYVRDDGSCDDTVQKILQIERADNRIRLVRDNLGNQGATGNFSALMKIAFEENADYLFFADQDDVWHPEKLAVMLDTFRQLELKQGAETPLLVHSDLLLVDEELQPMADSFVTYSGLSPATSGLGVLLCENQVTGCACAINRSLLELATPIPREALMHDWWLALLASSVGKIGFISRPLVRYRQHAGNVLGAMSYRQRIGRLISSLRQWKVQMTNIRRGLMQAAALEQRVRASRMGSPLNTLQQIDAYANILNVPRLHRIGALRTQGIGRSALGARWVLNLLITAMARKQEAS